MYKRYPIVIFLFTFLGASIHFMVFYLLDYLKGEKPKPLSHFSKGFHQVLYDLLITLFCFLVAFILFVAFVIRADS